MKLADVRVGQIVKSNVAATARGLRDKIVVRVSKTGLVAVRNLETKGKGDATAHFHPACLDLVREPPAYDPASLKIEIQGHLARALRPYVGKRSTPSLRAEIEAVTVRSLSDGRWPTPNPVAHYDEATKTVTVRDGERELAFRITEAPPAAPGATLAEVCQPTLTERRRELYGDVDPIALAAASSLYVPRASSDELPPWQALGMHRQGPLGE